MTRVTHSQYLRRQEIKEQLVDDVRHHRNRHQALSLPNEISHLEDGIKPIQFDPDECLADWVSIKAAIVLSAVLNPGSAHDFILCPNTAFLLESLQSDTAPLRPIDINVQNAVLRCGSDGSLDNNCLIIGGYAHFRMIESVRDVSFIGLTFSGASLSSILASGEADASVEFVNCAWIDNGGKASILVYNEAKGIPISSSTKMEELVQPREKSMTVSCRGCIFSRNILANSTVVNLGGVVKFEKSVFIANDVLGGVIMNKFESTLVLDGSCFLKNEMRLAGTVIVEENSTVELNKDTYGEMNAIGYGTCKEVLYEVGDSCVGGANPKCVGLCGYFTADTCQVDLEQISSIHNLIDDLVGLPGTGDDDQDMDDGGDGNLLSKQSLGIFIGVVVSILVVALCCMGFSYRFGQKSVLAQYAAIPIRDDPERESDGNRPCAIATPARPEQADVFSDNTPTTIDDNSEANRVPAAKPKLTAGAMKVPKPGLDVKPVEEKRNPKEKKTGDLPTFHRKLRRESNISDIGGVFSILSNVLSDEISDDDVSELGLLAKQKRIKDKVHDDIRKKEVVPRISKALPKKDEEKLERQKKREGGDSSELDSGEELESKQKAMDKGHKSERKNSDRKSRKGDKRQKKDEEVNSSKLDGVEFKDRSHKSKRKTSDRKSRKDDERQKKDLGVDSSKLDSDEDVESKQKSEDKGNNSERRNRDRKSRKDDETQKKDEGVDSSKLDSDEDVESKQKSEDKGHRSEWRNTDRKSRKGEEKSAKDDKSTRLASTKIEERNGKTKSAIKKDDEKQSDSAGKTSHQETNEKHDCDTITEDDDLKENKDDSLRFLSRKKKEEDKETSETIANKKSNREIKAEASDTDKYDSLRSSFRKKKGEKARSDPHGDKTQLHRSKKIAGYKAKRLVRETKATSIFHDTTLTSRSADREPKKFRDSGDIGDKEIRGERRASVDLVRARATQEKAKGDREESTKRAQSNSSDNSRFSSQVSESDCNQSLSTSAMSSRRSSLETNSAVSKGSSIDSIASIDSSLHESTSSVNIQNKSNAIPSKRASLDTTLSQAASAIQLIKEKRIISIGKLAEKHDVSRHKKNIPKEKLDITKKNKRDGMHRNILHKSSKERSLTPVKIRRLRNRSKSPSRQIEKKNLLEDKSREKTKRSSREKVRNDSTSPSRKVINKTDRVSRDRSELPIKTSKENRRKDKDLKETTEYVAKGSTTESLKPQKAKEDIKSLSKITRARRNLLREKSQTSESVKEKESIVKIAKFSETLEPGTGEKGPTKTKTVTNAQFLKDIGLATDRDRFGSSRAKHDSKHKPVDKSSLRPFDLKDLRVSKATSGIEDAKKLPDDLSKG
eukprot:scaffold4160_cov258-Chaetoceros_neogracile.AAC.14